MGLDGGVDFDLHRVLAREPLPIDTATIAGQVVGRRALLTGAGGSIGTALAALLVRWGVGELVAIDNHEHSLYELQNQLGRQPGITYYLADVRRPERLNRLFGRHRPEVVIHLAAYKHVPLGEENPEEVFVANVLGTLNVARAAAEAGAQVIAYSSTDKAVYPPSVYGATKRVVELALRAFSRERGGPRCGIVRLVNAVGAQGGVIRIFARQILAGQPLTVTDEGMTRFWISVEEAAQLVAQAACLAPGIDMIVPAVGPATRLTAVAHRLQALLRPEASPSFVVTGMRPGERLHELLRREDESLAACRHPGVLAVQDLAARPRFAEVEAAVAGLAEMAAAGDDVGLRRGLFALAAR